MPLQVEDKCLSCRHRTWAEFFRELSEEVSELADQIHNWLDEGECDGACEMECMNDRSLNDPSQIRELYRRGGEIMSGQLIVMQAERELTKE